MSLEYGGNCPKCGMSLWKGQYICPSCSEDELRKEREKERQRAIRDQQRIEEQKQAEERERRRRSDEVKQKQLAKQKSQAKQEPASDGWEGAKSIAGIITALGSGYFFYNLYESEYNWVGAIIVGIIAGSIMYNIFKGLVYIIIILVVIYLAYTFFIAA